MSRISGFYYKNNRLQQVRGFVNVVKYGGITKAAKEMHLTQSAVSHQIATLEDDLKIKLFKKIGIKLQLTEGGQRFYEMSIPHLQGIEDLFENFIINRDADEENHIKIAAHQFMMINYIPQWIAKIKKFNTDNKKLKFTLFNISKEEAIKKLINHELDAIFYDLDSSLHPELEMHKVIEEPFVLGFSKLRNYLLEKADNTINWDDILAEKLILTKSYYGQQLPNFLENRKNNIEIINGTYEIIKGIVLNNLGVSYCPISYLNEYDKSYINIKNISHLTGYYKAYIGIKKNTNSKLAILKLLEICKI